MKHLDELAQAGADSNDNRRRIEQLRNTYTRYLDPVRLVPRPKLSFNRNNDGYYRDYFRPLQRLP